jgi:hypothetical protein
MALAGLALRKIEAEHLLLVGWKGHRATIYTRIQRDPPPRKCVKCRDETWPCRAIQDHIAEALEANRD